MAWKWHSPGCDPPCCASDCLIFEDKFNGTSLQSYWTVEAGSWSVANGVLSTSSSNASLKYNLGVGTNSFARELILTVKSVDGLGILEPKLYGDDGSTTFFSLEIDFNNNTITGFSDSEVTGFLTDGNEVVNYTFSSDTWYNIRIVCENYFGETLGIADNCSSCPGAGTLQHCMVSVYIDSVRVLCWYEPFLSTGSPVDIETMRPEIHTTTAGEFEFDTITFNNLGLSEAASKPCDGLGIIGELTTTVINSGTQVVFDASAKTIQNNGGNWNLKACDVLTVTGSSSNNDSFLVDADTTSNIVQLDAASSVTNETTSSATITRLIPDDCELVNRCGWPDGPSIPAEIEVSITGAAAYTAVNEIQVIDMSCSSTPSSASYFTLTFDGQTTAHIVKSVGWGASDVQSALEALSNISPGDIIVTGGSLPSNPITVEFTGTYALTDVPEMTMFLAAGLACTSWGVTTTQNGGNCSSATNLNTTFTLDYVEDQSTAANPSLVFIGGHTDLCAIWELEFTPICDIDYILVMVHLDMAKIVVHNSTDNDTDISHVKICTDPDGNIVFDDWNGPNSPNNSFKIDLSSATATVSLP